MDYALVNGKVFTGEQVLLDQAVIIEGKTIKGLADPRDIKRGLKVVDLKGLSIAPGFIDLQVNGGGGSNDN